jgi:hypothetical protein
MAFTRATINLGCSREGSGIRVFMTKVGTNPSRLALTVKADIAGPRFGWHGKQAVVVEIGDGEHHGLIRFKREDAGNGNAIAELAGAGARSHFIVRLGPQPMFVDRAEASMPVQWELVDGWVEIVLPKWADETAPSRKPIAPPTTATGVHSIHPPQKRSVTAAVMGDPPAGRREMLDKIGSMKP